MRIASPAMANAGGILLYEYASDNVGLAYDSLAVSERERTFDTPMAESWRLATGVGYVFDRSAELNLSYTFVWMGDMPVSQSKGLNGRISTSGEFADAAIHVLSSSITWRY